MLFVFCFLEDLRNGKNQYISVCAVGMLFRCLAKRPYFDVFVFSISFFVFFVEMRFHDMV